MDSVVEEETHLNNENDKTSNVEEMESFLWQESDQFHSSSEAMFAKEVAQGSRWFTELKQEGKINTTKARAANTSNDFQYF